MKILKKISVVAVALVIFFSFLALISSSAKAQVTGPLLSVDQPNTNYTAAAGGNFQVAINAGNFSNVTSVQFVVTYDPSLLSVSNVTPGPMLDSSWNLTFNNSQPGILIVAMYGNALNQNSTPSLALISFNVASTALTAQSEIKIVPNGILGSAYVTSVNGQDLGEASLTSGFFVLQQMAQSPIWQEVDNCDPGTAPAVGISSSYTCNTPYSDNINPLKQIASPFTFYANTYNPVRFKVRTANSSDQLSAPYLPEGASFDATTGIFDWAPVSSMAGSYDIAFYASNGQSVTAKLVVTVIVNLEIHILPSSPYGSVNIDKSGRIVTADTYLSYAPGASPFFEADSNAGYLVNQAILNGAPTTWNGQVLEYNQNYADVPFAPIGDSQTLEFTFMPAGYTPPKVSIFSLNALTQNVLTALSASATALNAGATINHVDFYIGITKIGTVSTVDANGNYTMNWSFPTIGNFNLVARAYDSYGVSTASSPVSIAVTTPPVGVVITTQPVNQTVLSGQTATFTVAATGTPLPTYQWQSSPDGNSWTNITGATGSQYSFNAQSSMDQNYYRAVVSNYQGLVQYSTVTSSAVQLTVNSAPTITVDVNTQAQTINQGSVASYSVTAAGTPTLTYQWQMSTAGGAFSNIAGATSSTYSFTATSAVNYNTQYQCIVSNNYGSVTSSVSGVLTVFAANAPSVAITSPVNGASIPAGSAVLYAQATEYGGSGIKEVDFYNGTNELGVGTPVSVDANGNGYYAFNYSISTVTNYAFNVVALDKQSPSVSTQSATVSVTGANASGSLLSIYIPGGNGSVQVLNTWTTPWATTLTPISSNGNIYQYAVNSSGNYYITASPAGQYQIQTVTMDGVAQALNQWGQFVLSMPRANHSVMIVFAKLMPPSITTEPVNQTVAAQAVATFSVAATGVPVPKYQWGSSAPGTGVFTAIAGATSSSYAVPAASLSMSGTQYECVVSNSQGTVTSNAASLTVNPVTFNISASASANGNMTPNGIINIASGANQIFSVTANSGYTANLAVDGNLVVLTNGQYTLSNVTANHTVSASFTLNTFSLIATAGANGTITPNGNTTVNYGSNQTITVTPAAGYTAGLTVDGNSVSLTNNTYSLNNVTGNHNLSASFTPTTPASLLTLTVSSGGYVLVSKLVNNIWVPVIPVSPNTYSFISSDYVRMDTNPYLGYVLGQVTDNGQSAVGEIDQWNTIWIRPMNGNHVVNVNFATTNPVVIPVTLPVVSAPIVTVPVVAPSTTSSTNSTTNTATNTTNNTTTTPKPTATLTISLSSGGYVVVSKLVNNIWVPITAASPHTYSLAPSDYVRIDTYPFTTYQLGAVTDNNQNDSGNIDQWGTIWIKPMGGNHLVAVTFKQNS